MQGNSGARLSRIMENDMNNQLKIGTYKAHRGGHHWWAKLPNGQQIESEFGVTYKTRTEALSAAKQAAIATTN